MSATPKLAVVANTADTVLTGHRRRQAVLREQTISPEELKDVIFRVGPRLADVRRELRSSTISHRSQRFPKGI